MPSGFAMNPHPFCQTNCLLVSASQFQKKSLFPQPISFDFISGARTLCQCIEEILAAKTSANRSPRYVVSLGYYLRQFSKGRMDEPISDLTFLDVESWLKKYPSGQTKRAWISRLSALFAFAVRRGYMKENPCARLERVSVDRSPPLVLTPGQSRQVLAASPMMMRPYFLLASFVGLRPEELTRLDWSQVNLETKIVTINFGKTRRHRFVPLPETAVDELQKCPLKAGQVTPSNSTVRRWRSKMTKLLGLAKWPQDFLRHTAASYLYERHCDAALVAKWLGNSEKVLMSTYIVPVSAENCAEFWRDSAAVTQTGSVTAQPVTQEATPETTIRASNVKNGVNGSL
jgi:integrase